MSADLAATCQGSGLAQGHTRSLPVPGGGWHGDASAPAAGSGTKAQPGALRGARRSHGHCGCQPRPMSPLRDPVPVPRGGRAIGQHRGRSRAPCSSRWHLPRGLLSHHPAAPAAPRSSTRAPARSQGLARKGTGAQTRPTAPPGPAPAGAPQAWGAAPRAHGCYGQPLIPASPGPPSPSPGTLDGAAGTLPRARGREMVPCLPRDSPA